MAIRSRLSDSITNLSRLRNLDLAHTRITALPENIAQMTSLRTLLLVRCPVSAAEKTRIRQALPKCHVAF